MSLAVLVLAIYGQTLSFDFVNLDDPEYVHENDRVTAGLTASGIVWAFITTHEANWHPLTWLSLMLDAEIGGMKPGIFHLTNVALHLINSWLLFLAFHRMTRSTWRAAFVACLFAAHPLHVESVAWVAERKDVLSTSFWFLALLAHVRFTERPGAWRRWLIAAALAAGLMAKPMLVTLPFTLLLLDFWPLRRFVPGESGASAAWSLVREKLPLFAMAAASSVVTLYAQRAGGAVRPLETFPVPVRAVNALIAYATYLGKSFWPLNLAAFYPHQRDGISAGSAILAGLLLAAVTVVAIRTSRTRPYLAVGWSWYVVTLVPVSGLVQVGVQAMADRYTYVPLIGIFVCIAWGVPDVARAATSGARGWLLCLAGASLVVALAVASFFQVGYWRDGVTLFERSIDVTGSNAFAENNLASALYRKDRLDGAISHWNEALRLHPDFPAAHSGLGQALIRKGRVGEAIRHWESALATDPDNVTVRCNLAGALFRTGRTEEAAVHGREALRVDPELACAHYNLGLCSLRQGRIDEAGVHFAEVVRVQPDYVDGRLNLGVVRYRQGRIDEAAEQFSEALRLDPGNEAARKNLDAAIESRRF